ncbi:unnamed protein product [Victoria cruziana]
MYLQFLILNFENNFENIKSIRHVLHNKKASLIIRADQASSIDRELLIAFTAEVRSLLIEGMLSIYMRKRAQSSAR